MYQIADQVVYGIHGVCKIVDQEKRVVDRKTVTYLVLEPVGQEGSRYLVPTHNEVAMSKIRPMLTPEQMEMLLHSEEIRTDNWIREENLRKNTYRELITSGDRAELLRMVYTLYNHRKEQTAIGKKVHLADDNFLRDAEKLLASEISVVMDMPQDQARTYLRTQLQSK